MPTEGTATLDIAGHALVVSDVAGRSAMNELFTIRVRATTPEEALVGEKFTLAIDDVLHVHGIVSAAAVESRRGDLHAELTLAPDVFPLTLGLGSLAFQNLSAVDVVKKVLTEAGIESSATKWSLKGTYAARPYITQRAESDWDFVTRLLAEEGISFFFDFEDDATTLTFTDDTTTVETSQKMPHRSTFGVRPAAGTAWVSRLVAREAIAHDSVLVRDRDAAKPALALEGKAGSATTHTYYEWPGRFSVAADGTARAKKMLEALAGGAAIRSGITGDTKIACGKGFEITEHPTAARNEKLVCVEQTFALSDGAEHATFAWRAVPASKAHRPAWRGALHAPFGLEPAVVTGSSGAEIDADKDAKVVALPLWDRVGKKDEKASVRMRSAQMALAESVMLPRIGFAMFLSHHDGDVDRPWVYARATDGEHPPAYKQPDNKTRSAWQTLTSPSDGTSTELRFEDKADSEEIFWNAAKDMTVTIGDNDAWTIGNADSLEITGDRKITIGADDKLTVTSDQATTIKGKASDTIAGKRSLTVNGSETVKVDGARKTKVSADTTCDVTGAITIEVGDAMKTISKKGIAREVLKKQSEKSGGAWTTQTDAGFAFTVIGDGKEDVTGARSETAGKGVQTLVAGDMSESIAAGYTITAQGGFGESAKGKLALKASAGVTATGQTIEIEGKSEITITCGASTFTIKSDGVEVKSATVTCTGPMIVNDGATVKHNP